MNRGAMIAGCVLVVAASTHVTPPALAAAAEASTAAAAEDDWDDDWGAGTEEPAGGAVWSGFVEAAGGMRTDGGSEPTGATLGEVRVRAETEWVRDGVTLTFKGDALGDAALENADLLVRDLTIRLPIGERIDLKAGRQVMTWGTGDLLFLNDLFPKDFESFFAGREDDYLKAPANAVRMTAYGDAVNVDFVWMPVFKSDVYLDGSRFSFYDPTSGRIEAPDPPLHTENPDPTPANGEFALRLFRQAGGVEYAAYGYRGFFKQPTALDDRGRPTFAPLTVAGASLRRPLGPGLFNAEFAWYASRDDRSGRDPAVPNSQARWLLGYEREIVTNLTGSVQYYGERIQHHDQLRDTTPEGLPIADQWRTVLTARLTWRAMMDKLTLGTFVFVSPSDRDWHLRPALTWRISDAWQFSAGLNLFGGAHDWTFFGQLEENSNGYLRIRRYY